MNNMINPCFITKQARALLFCAFNSVRILCELYLPDCLLFLAEFCSFSCSYKADFFGKSLRVGNRKGSRESSYENEIWEDSRIKVASSGSFVHNKFPLKSRCGAFFNNANFGRNPLNLKSLVLKRNVVFCSTTDSQRYLLFRIILLSAWY